MVELGNLIDSTFETFKDIKNTSSRTDKEKLIHSQKDNEVFTKLLQLAYDPYLIFGIKKDPKVVAKGNQSVLHNFEEFLVLTSRLSSRLSTGNTAIEDLSNFLSGCTEDEYEWYMNIIRRDLRVGITGKTINKVMPKLIPNFTCALAENIRPNSFPKRSIIERKLDGYRCLALHREDGTVELRSRNGKEINGYCEIEDQVANLPKGFIYDGEIMGRKGTFNEVQTQAFKKSKNKDGVLEIFDMVSLLEFENDTFSKPLTERLHDLNDIRGLEEDLTSIAFVEQVGTFTNSEEDMSTIYEYHTRFVEEGFEGTMVKNADTLYKKGKSRNIQKIKDMDTEDLVITGTYRGEEGKQFEDTLGGFTVDWKGNPVGVGSGFTIDQRKDFWDRRDEMINKTIEVAFQEESKDKNGKESLRFTVFKGFRPDKD